MVFAVSLTTSTTSNRKPSASATWNPTFNSPAVMIYGEVLRYLETIDLWFCSASSSEDAWSSATSSRQESKRNIQEI